MIAVFDRVIDICRVSFSTFLFNYCRTYDWNDPPNPLKLFPQDPCYKKIAEILPNEQYILIAKSRQLSITWLCCCYEAWKAWKQTSYILVKSTKEDKAAWGAKKTVKGNDETEVGDKQSLLSRTNLILTNLDEDIFQPDIEIAPIRKPPGITIVNKKFKHESTIKALTDNPNEARGDTTTDLFIDEGAQQKDAREAYAAMSPSLTDESQIIIASTFKNKEWFFDLVYELEGTTDGKIMELAL